MFEEAGLVDRAVEAYDYDLPAHLIAQRPASPRDSSRLLVVRAGSDQNEHARFRDLPRFLRAGDLLVVNETRVIRARLLGVRDSGGNVELLLLHPTHSHRYDSRASRWLALAKPARRLRPGSRIHFGELGEAEVLAEREQGIREIAFHLHVPFETFLERAGTLPLPPYVTAASVEAQQGYQTIFASEPGSVAAPTASLHFTQRVLDDLDMQGVRIARLVLDVGLGTFRPMKSARIDEHVMHVERYDIPAETAAAIAAAKAQGRRVIASGTTTLRALEASAQKHGAVRAGEDETNLFITPGFEFHVADALITNFHLPRSTLLVLSSAFAGREAVLRAYREAIERKYRFFSFGDAMLLER